MIGEALRAGLKREGFTVDWVHEARAAEGVLGSEPFELLLLDLGLPGRPKSRSSSSNGSVRNAAPAARASCTQSTVKPSRFRPARMASPIMASSSTSSSLTVCKV